MRSLCPAGEAAMTSTTDGRRNPGHQATSPAEDATLAAIVRSAPDAVISKTVDGIVTSWNAAAERLYGYRAEQMIGRPIESTFPADKMQEESDRHARVAAGVSESGFRCSRLHADGHLVDVVMSM